MCYYKWICRMIRWNRLSLHSLMVKHCTVNTSNSGSNPDVDVWMNKHV